MQSQSTSCHLCHLHNHGGEPLLRTVPLRTSRNRTRRSRNHYYHHEHDHGPIYDSGDNSRRNQANSASSLARLIERHSLPGSRSNSFDRFDNGVSVFPTGDYARRVRVNDSTRSLEVNPDMHQHPLERRSSSIPRGLTSRSHLDIRQEHDILARQYPFSSSNSLSRQLPKSSGFGLDNGQDYYFHIQRKPKQKLSGRRCKLKTVLLIGCYSLLVLASIMVGLIISYQNGWLGLSAFNAKLTNGVTEIPPSQLEVHYDSNIGNIQSSPELKATISSIHDNEVIREQKEDRGQPDLDVAELFPIRNVPSLGAPKYIFTSEVNRDRNQENIFENSKNTLQNNIHSTHIRPFTINEFDKVNPSNLFIGSNTNQNINLNHHQNSVENPHLQANIPFNPHLPIKNSMNQVVHDFDQPRNNINLLPSISHSSGHGHKIFENNRNRNIVNGQPILTNVPNSEIITVYRHADNTNALSTAINPSTGGLNIANQHNNNVLVSDRGLALQRGNRLHQQSSNSNKQVVLGNTSKRGNNVLNQPGSIINKELVDTRITNTPGAILNYPHNNINTDPATINLPNISKNILPTSNKRDHHTFIRNSQKQDSKRKSEVSNNISEGFGRSLDRNRQFTANEKLTENTKQQQNVGLTPPFTISLKNKAPTFRLILKDPNVPSIIPPTVFNKIEIADLNQKLEKLPSGNTVSNSAFAPIISNDDSTLAVSLIHKTSNINRPSDNIHKSLDSRFSPDHKLEKNVARHIQTSLRNKVNMERQKQVNALLNDNNGNNSDVADQLILSKQTRESKMSSTSNINNQNVSPELLEIKMLLKNNNGKARKIDRKEAYELTTQLRDEVIKQLKSGTSSDHIESMSAVENISTSELIDLVAVRRIRDLIKSEEGVQTLFAFLKSSHENNEPAEDTKIKNILLSTTKIGESLSRSTTRTNPVIDQTTKQGKVIATSILEDMSNQVKLLKSNKLNTNTSKVVNVKPVDLEMLIRVSLSQLLSKNATRLETSDKENIMKSKIENESHPSSEIVHIKTKDANDKANQPLLVSSSQIRVIPLQNERTVLQSNPISQSARQELDVKEMKKFKISQQKNQVSENNNKSMPITRALPASSSKQSNLFLRQMLNTLSNNRGTAKTVEETIPKFRVRLKDNNKSKLRLVLSPSTLQGQTDIKILPELVKTPQVQQKSAVQQQLHTMAESFTPNQLAQIRAAMEEIQKKSNAAKTNKFSISKENKKRPSLSNHRLFNVNRSRQNTPNVHLNHGSPLNSRHILPEIRTVTSANNKNNLAGFTPRDSNLQDLSNGNNKNKSKLHSVSQRMQIPLNLSPQLLALPNPDFSILFQTAKNKDIQPIRLGSNSGFTELSQGGSEPFTELVQVNPVTTINNTDIIRAWTHMDNAGTVSKGQVRSDGSFAFTNCRPSTLCNNKF